MRFQPLHSPSLLASFILLSFAMACSGGPTGAACRPPACEPPPSGVTQIDGFVVDPEGRPVPAARIESTPWTGPAVTGADGRFRLHVPYSAVPRTFEIRVTAPGRPATSAVVPVAAGIGVTPVTVTVPALPDLPPGLPGPPPTLAGFDVRTWLDDEVRLCLAGGDTLTFRVDVRNATGAPLSEVVLSDSLDAEDFLTLRPEDVVVNRARFPQATVSIDPGGSSFTVRLGALASTRGEGSADFVEAYRVSPRIVGRRGVWCNEVAARGLAGAAAVGAADMGCVTQTLALLIDVENDDGALVAGAFDPAPESFAVGDGGNARTDGLLYRVRITNRMCEPLAATRVAGSIVGAGAVALRAVQGGPTAGTVSALSAAAYAWEIGDLAPGASVELVLRAEALAPGDAVHRVRLESASFPGVILDEEITTVLP